MSELLRRLAELSPEKRAILVAELKKREGDSASARSISPRKQFTPAPLSFAQQRLWFLDQYEPDSPFYNVYSAFRLTGNLDVVSLERSLTEIVNRHESLRTVFLSVEGQALQDIQPAQPVCLVHHDLSALDDGARDTQCEQLVTHEIRRPFDLMHGPLLRATLIRLRNEEQILLLTTHHIISDAWSIGVMMRELSAFYNHFASAASLDLSELPIQYADFAVCQRAWLESGALDEQLIYWKRQLADLPASSLVLPTDRLRPSVLTNKGGCEELYLSAELTESLKAFSLKHNVTLFMTLLTGFYALLRCYSGSKDICIGTPISGRNDGETHGLIGFFVNTLVLRFNDIDSSSFRAAVAEVRQTVINAFANQDVPFEQLVDALQPERDPSRTPLFQVLFALQNAPAHDLELSGLEITELELQTGTSKFDLTLAAREEGLGLRLVMEYASDLFESDTIERLMVHYRDLLESMMAHPDNAITPSILINDAERRQQLEEWNETTGEFPRESSVQELFEAQVLKRPEAVAVVYGAEQLSYRQLNERANQLAHYLRKRGVGPEVVVGVSQERSLDLAVSLLGILKAGGAYLPLDPSYPEARRAYMLNDAEARVLIAKAGSAEDLTAGVANEVEVVSLEGEAEELARESKENPARQGWAENLAYVTYTSGSTGEPKGIGVTHRSVLRLVCNSNYVQVNEQDVVAQAATISFDASTFELWGALLNGARLVGVGRSELLAPGELGKKLRAAEVSVLFLTTALFNEVVRQEPGAFAGVKHLLFGGEQVDVGIVRKLVEGGSKPERLLHVYGPTEVTTYATWSEVQEVGVEAQTIAIGRPLSNTEAYVLDERQELVPVGVVGELYLGGEGLARGYVGAAELTSEKFVPHPFSREVGARLYRTGDLVRYRRDGELEFVGRVDEQLKIRGFRIEPGEVESVLREHAQVVDAVVLGWQEESGEKRLVAYLVMKSDGIFSVPTANQLRMYLREKLPEYMMPAGFVYLAELPLNANGKVDRAALPAPEWEQGSSEEWVGPRTAVEEVLCGIWAEVLRVERVSVNDNFFELGGDSILSIQIVAKARQQGLHLSPKLLFQYQNIAELSEQVKENVGSEAPQGVVTGEVLLTPIQHWFFEQQLARPEHWNQALLLESRDPLDAELLKRSWRELVAHHDGLRQRYRYEGGAWRQEIKAPTSTDVSFASYDLSDLSEGEQRQRLAESANELQRSLDLEQGPLVQVGWYERGAAGGWLLVIIHHLVVDGVSWRILLEDLEQVYEQLVGGSEVKLAPKSNSLVQWSERLREYARSEVVREEAAYWLEQGAMQVKGLPRDHKDGENVEASVRIASGSLSEEETQGLLQEVPGRYQTQITEVLLWGMMEAMWKWSGERVVRVALEGHGREAINSEVEVTRTVGWFTTLYPVIVDLRQVYERGAALKAVKEQLRRIPHRGIGYGALRYLGSEQEVSERLRDQEEAELSFNYLGQFDQVLKPGGWLRAAREGSGVARYEAGRRQFLLDVTSSVVSGRLQMSVLYSEALHKAETMDKLIADCLQELRELIGQSREEATVDYSPADFPQARLSQRELGEVLAEISESVFEK
jgi:amino acid adenylation domain-containing protein/non-ribosomal peptide synthase protein (TIGR01720 family)